MQNPNDSSIEQLQRRIDQITDDLQSLHIREGLSKAQLNDAIEKKYRLSAYGSLSHSTDRRLHRSDTIDHPPVEAVVVERSNTHQSSDTSNRDRNNNRSIGSNNKQTIRKDRDGVIIEIGDEVEFLTKSKNISKG